MKAIISILILLVFIVPNNAFAQEENSVSGTIHWSSGTAALGVPVKLLKNGKVEAETYSNQAGKFIFRDLKEPLTKYKLEICPDNKSVCTIKDLEKGSSGQSITIK